MKNWTAMVEEWKKTIFNQIDRDKIQKKVEEYDKISSMCWMNLEKNKMAVLFWEKVEEMKDTLPVVTYLWDDAL